jgi:hypothetical protein
MEEALRRFRKEREAAPKDKSGFSLNAVPFGSRKAGAVA